MAAPNKSAFAFQNRGGIMLIEDQSQTSGTRFYVDYTTGTDHASRGNSPATPLKTLDYAIGLCTAGKGDVIYLMPGHAEVVATAGAIACDVAGIKIQGLGWGGIRPTFTWSGTAGTIAISAASTYIQNIVCTCSADEVVKMFNITAADVTLDKVDYVETATKQPIQFLLTTNAADRLTVKNCRHYHGTAPTGNSAWIQLVGVDDVCIVDNFFHMTFSNHAASVTISGTTALVRGEIARNTIIQLGGTTQVSAILLVDTSTTFVHDNRVAAGTTALPGIVDVGNAGYAAENYALNTPDKSGILDPVVDS